MHPDKVRGDLVQDERDRSEVCGDVPIDGLGHLLPLTGSRHEPVIPRLMPHNPRPRHLVHDRAV
ncbi:hypothetical protein GCM10009658_55440 [Planotetraspora silvatica]